MLPDPACLQLPGGERVPFLFTVKELTAKGSLDGFGGDFVVPSYRGSSFLDPKVNSLPVSASRGHCICHLARLTVNSMLMPQVRLLWPLHQVPRPPEAYICHQQQCPAHAVL